MKGFHLMMIIQKTDDGLYNRNIYHYHYYTTIVIIEVTHSRTKLLEKIQEIQQQPVTLDFKKNS